MQMTVGIGLLGCGTVGSAVAERLIENADIIERRTGIRCELRGIATRRSNTARAIVEDPAVDVVIETIGGINDAADLVERALDRGRHVITANKDLIATQGPRLIALAKARGVGLRYEAAACSAVPVVRTIVDALAGDRVLSLAGVLNGTTTSVLSAMEEGAEYDEALAQARSRGFAEADAANDVDGIDATHKLALLLQLAFESAVISPRIHHRGIANVTPRDVARAARRGYRIRLVAAALRAPAGALAEVGPVLVRVDHPFANTRGVENVVRIGARDAGTLLLSGLGAGGAASASPILGDLVTLLRDPKSTTSRFEPAIDIAPFFARLRCLDDLPQLPVWEDSILNAPASQASLAFARPGKGPS
jgi:homoserine dehydrogenase